MRKTTGWLLIGFGVLWGAVVLMHAPPAGPDGLGISRLLGAVLIPILVVLLGLYLAGVIRKAK